MADGDISLNLTLDNRDFTVTVNNTGKILSQLRADLSKTADATDKIQKHTNSFSTSFRHLVMSAAAVRFALLDIHDIFLRLPMGILKTAGEMERLTKLMGGLSVATTEAGRSQEALANTNHIINLAKNAPFEINALSNAFVKLKSGGIDPTNGSLQALVDSVARFGGDSQSLHRAAVAIQQMAGKGVISMEELRQQLGESIPDAMKLMAQGMGMSLAELTKKVSLGAVESTDALRRMFTMMEFYNKGAAAEMMETWTGLTSRLGTEWTLLQTEIAKGGLADAAKDQLKDLINFMGSAEGVAMARQFGYELSIVVKTIRAFIDILIESFEWIRAVGTALIVYFALDRARAFYTFMRDAITGRIALLKEEYAEIARKKAADVKMRADAIASAASEASAKAAIDQAALAKKQAYYKGLETRHANYLAKIRAMDAANELSRARLINGATAEAAVIAARRAEIESIRKKAEATQVLITKERQVQKALHDTATASHIHATNLNMAANAATNAASNVGVMARAAGMLRVGLAALGGPIGIITTALMFGIPAWLEWGNSGEKAIQKIKDALNSGNANSETIDLITQQLNAKRKELDELNNKTRGFSLLPKSANDVQNEIAERRKLEGEIKELEENMFRAREQRSENAAAAAISSQRRAFNEELADVRRQYASKARILQDDAKRKLDTLKKGSDEQIRLDKETNLAIVKTVQARSDAEMAILEKHRKKAKALLEDATKGGNKDAIKGAQRFYDELTDESIAKDLERFRNDAMHLSDPTNMGVAKLKKPDPLQQALEKARGDLEAAKIRMDDLLDGAITFARLKDAAFAELMGDRLAGRFNTKDDRGNSVMPDASRPEFDETAEKIAAKNKIDRERTVQKALIGLSAQTAQERENAMERFNASEYYDRESTGVRRLERQLAKLKGDLVEGSDEFNNFKENTKKIISDQAIADLLNFSATFKRTRDEIEVGLKTTDIGRKKAAYELEIKTIESQLERLEKEIKDSAGIVSDEVMATLVKASKEYKLLLDSLAREQARKLMTPLQQLSEQWEDITNQMRQASTRWTNDTLDNIVNMVKGGKFEWRSLVDSILTDIARISLQKGIGGAINSIFDQGVNMIAGGLFGADTAMGSNKIPIDPATGAVPTVDVGSVGKATEAIKQSEIFKTAGERLTSMWESVKSGMGNVWSGLTNMLGSLGTGLSNLVSGLGSALSNFMSSMSGGTTGFLGELLGVVVNVATSAIGSFGGFGGAAASAGTASYTGYGGMGSPTMMRFEKGGIMTEYGPLKLKKYLNGGIANSPQLALYGEGRRPEAYVPLPDGRTIPVTLKGGMGGGDVLINITIHEGNEQTNTSGGNDAELWNRMAKRVKGVVQEELIIQKRAGGSLYNK